MAVEAGVAARIRAPGSRFEGGLEEGPILAGGAGLAVRREILAVEAVADGHGGGRSLQSRGRYGEAEFVAATVARRAGMVRRVETLDKI